MDTLKLEDLDIYQLALAIGEDVWSIVIKWEYFSKATIGKQFVEASDSISANIAEGYGRYFYKDRKSFCYYSRGSLLETKNWATKARNRSLIQQDEYDLLLEKLRTLHHKLNGYIKKLKTTSQ
ncbi:four helix bundle protein [Flavisolibacter nicotianae]|uniref:four helix bundle protein n=1 Tax=Flavisolibacter nicotianae TaxID=2364882 RepID=UPI000EAF6FF0|nr:four helix bundle protein [Flavisolibacter nicotianae]